MKPIHFSKRPSVIARVAAFFAVFALVGWTGVGLAFASEDAQNIAVSKVASSSVLDESYETGITITFPSEEVQLVTDVVFVVDDSQGREVMKGEYLSMLQELSAQVTSSGAAVRVGAVMYRGNATEKQFPLTTLNDDTAAQLVEFASGEPNERGSNMHAGLLAAKQMLEGSSTPADRQYLTLISDGNIYSWDEGGVQTAIAFTSGGKPHYAGVESWNHNTKWKPSEGWGAYLDASASKIAKSKAEHAAPYDRKNIQNPLTEEKEKSGEYADSKDVAMDMTRATYKELAAKYHCYSVGLEPFKGYYGKTFMDYLGSIEGGTAPDVSVIKNDILYMMSAGSVLHDVMGSGTDSEGNAYDFDFVDDASTITLKVGDVDYGNPTDRGNGVFVFGEPNGSKDGSTYPFILRYDAANDAYDLEINVDVTNFERVKLDYKVRLTNPQKDPGTYQDLLTNSDTTVKPVDSDCNPGEPVSVESPVVEYTVAAPEPEPEPEPKPEPEPEPEPVPAPGTKPVPTRQPKQVRGKLPATGDSNSALPVAVLAGASVVLVGSGMLLRRKNER